MTNALAYHGMEIITTVKSFTVEAPAIFPEWQLESFFLKACQIVFTFLLFSFFFTFFNALLYSIDIYEVFKHALFTGVSEFIDI